jgi:hypothetical protein
LGAVDDVPDFGRTAVDEFGSELQRQGGQRIVNGMDAPADPVAGFEAKRVAAGAIQLAEGGQAGGSGSNYDYVDVRRHGLFFGRP